MLRKVLKFVAVGAVIAILVLMWALRSRRVFDYPVPPEIWFGIDRNPVTDFGRPVRDYLASPAGPRIQRSHAYKRNDLDAVYFVVALDGWYVFPDTEINGFARPRKFRGYRFSETSKEVDGRVYRRFELDRRDGANELAEEFVDWWEHGGAKPEPPPLPAKFR
jgi:hypothetical protein